MDASMSMLTLGVRDLSVARRFYVDGLGWAPAFEVEADVCFIRVGPAFLLGLWNRDSLSTEAGGVYLGDQPAPISLGGGVQPLDRARVDGDPRGGSRGRPHPYSRLAPGYGRVDTVTVNFALLPTTRVGPTARVSALS